MTPRIAIIGGGSAHWTPRLLLDFVNTASLAESEVVLMDTAPDSLPAVQGVADHIASLGAGGLDVTTTTDPLMRLNVPWFSKLIPTPN